MYWKLHAILVHHHFINLIFMLYSRYPCDSPWN